MEERSRHRLSTVALRLQRSLLGASLTPSVKRVMRSLWRRNARGAMHNAPRCLSQCESGSAVKLAFASAAVSSLTRAVERQLNAGSASRLCSVDS